MSTVIPQKDEQMSFVLRYTGPAVTDGTMDVYDVARNMVAFSDYVIVAAHSVFGSQAEVRADVSAFKQGSFVTDLAFHVAGAGAALYAVTPDLGGLFVTVRESLGLFRFLKGEKPAAVQIVDDHSINVQNINGEGITVNITSYNVTMDPKAGKSAATFVGAALEKAGIQEVEIESETARLVAIGESDAQYFRQIELVSEATETVFRLGLVIEAPSFKEGNKWRFWDGDSSITATILDPVFLQRIDNGEPFRKGDALVCDVRITQSGSGSNLKMERAVIKVHEHVQGHEQPDLLGHEDIE